MDTVTFTILNDRKKAFLRSNIILKPRMFMQIRIPINVTKKKEKKEKENDPKYYDENILSLFIIRNS